MNQPLPPSRSIFRVFFQTLWTLLRGAWNMVAWDSVRAGTVDLKNTSRSFRALMRVGLWLVLLLLVGLLVSDVWRVISPLQPLTFYSDALAGSYAPELFVPVVFALLAMAWAYVICGALHAHWIVKLVVLGLFALFDFGLMLTPLFSVPDEITLLFSNFSFELWATAASLIHVVGGLALLVLFGLRWRRAPKPGLEFPLTLGLMTVMMFAAYVGALHGAATLGGNSMATALQLTQALGQISTFLIPFLLISGIEVAQLGMSVTQLVSRGLKSRIELQQGWGRTLWAIGLAGFLLYRLSVDWIVPLVKGETLNFRWGALIIVLIFLLVFLLTRRAAFRAGGDLPGWVIPVVAIAFYGTLFVLDLGALIAQVFGGILVSLGESSGEQVVAASASFFNFIAEWNEVFVGVVVLVIGLVIWFWAMLQRKPFPTTTLYLVIFVIWMWGWVFTRAGRVLGILNFTYTDLAALVTVLLIILFIVALLPRSGRLTPTVLLYLTATAVLFWALGFRSLLSDPLSPVFGLLGAEAAFISVSLFLNVMGAGNRFRLNAESPAMPRYTRGLLYFGYALLTVTSVNWLAAGHEVNALAQKDLIAQNGYIAIGLPLAFWALMTGSEAVMGEEGRPMTNDE